MVYCVQRALHLVVLCIGFGALSAAAPTFAEPVTQDAVPRGAVRLVEHRSLCAPGQKWSNNSEHPVGAAFFVEDWQAGEVQLYAVTARHVVEDLAVLYATVRLVSEQQPTVVLQLPREGWIFHPNSGGGEEFPVDVAVIKLAAQKGVSVFVYCPARGRCQGADFRGEPLNNQLESAPRVMQRAVFFGFLAMEADAGAAMPFARAGIVALQTPQSALRIDDKPLADRGIYLLDARNFDRGSGAPVIAEPADAEATVQLQGLVTGGVAAAGDFTLVTPVERIKEAIQHARTGSGSTTGVWQDSAPQSVRRCEE